MQTFWKDFEFVDNDNQNKFAFYNMDDSLYRVFMIKIFESLNPIQFDRGFKIFSELDDVSQVIYVMKGKYRAGYAINNQEMLKIQFSKGTRIGAFECSYDRRSKYIYRAATDVEGYFINKRNWKQLELNHPLLFQRVRRRALHHFSHVIHKNLEIFK